ncbi:uncharacterized protein LOC121728542 [Aricia agestis]|uniref:uncharacterized protein LOC121728542 n=1 Tax=Aricia agestis TaxID=91739 RepID=UPI001C201F19|nr:uncharacterized protein LOC121728542 [Aricia agestis]
MNILAQICLLILFASVKSYEIQYKNTQLEDLASWRHSSVKRQAIKTSEDTIQHEAIKLPTNSSVIGLNDIQVVKNDDSKTAPQENDIVQPPGITNSTTKSETNSEAKNDVTEAVKESSPNTTGQVAPSAIKSDTVTSKPTDSVNILPLNNPGVVKRGLIVFGGFALLAVAYFVFYRRKGKNYDSNNTHNNNDNNQFRYGVLQSEEGRDNLELSRIPLTMESDEDDEDDLEIFDLEQKKQSLSYVNLQANDEDIVFHNRKDESKNNLLLDIEEGPSDMINWSSTSNKSIL